MSEPNDKACRETDSSARTLEEWKAICKGTIIPFLTSLAGVENSQIRMWGSGTFVTVDEHLCVLTAHHVLYGAGGKHGVLDFPEIGLLASREDQQPTFKRELFTRVRASKFAGGEWGPDLAVLMLPESMKGEIEALSKSFYSLREGRKEWKGISFDDESIVWVLAGAPGEKATETEAGLEMEYQLGLGNAPARRVVGGFELLDFLATYEAPCDPPESFGGYSGGGLWALRLGPDGKSWRPILMGVPYWELERKGNARYVRCHGPADIYGAAYDTFLAAITARRNRSVGGATLDPVGGD